ncbi:MAG: DnaJ domain-containing protein [Proteobacteria bacterium]|nr:DnaJ domain-containing protein [Pseudomonadota bacterium]
MSRIPDPIDNLGKASDRLRPNPEFDAANHPFDSDSYFVWSRIDGVTSIRDIILMVGFPIDHTIAILNQLRECGALLLPGENPASVIHRLNRARAKTATGPRRAAAPTAERRIRRVTGRTGEPAKSPGRAPTDDSIPAVPTGPSKPAASPQKDSLNDLEPLDAEESTAMLAEVTLSEESKVRIIAMRRKLRRANYFNLLGVPTEVDKRELKRAYRRLSKAFHPDRYYGRKTGPFGPWLAEIFETLTKAFDVLSDGKMRAQYMIAIQGGATPARVEAQTQTEYAAELFERGRQNETSGDLAVALKLFAAAVRLDPQTRYLSRAARCALAAQRLREAEEYASKAAELEPDDPSILRVLADVYRAFGKLRHAEEVLVSALALKSENDVLGKGLRTDLAQVRAELDRLNR